MAEIRIGGDTEFGGGRERAARRRGDGGVYRICVLGDFGGSVKTQRPVEIDRDNFETVMAALGVTLSFTGSRGPETLRFASLDDFHPDRLLERIALPPEAPTAPRPQALSPAPAPDAAAPPESLLDAVFSATSGEPQRRDSLADRLVAEALAKVPVQAASPPSAAPGEAAAEAIRALLHDPRFRALEAAWRGLDLLVRRLETGSELKLFLLDWPAAELIAALQGENPAQTRFCKLLVEPAIDENGAPWSLWLGLHRFGAEAAHAALLARVARLAAAAGASFIADAEPSLFGCASLAGAPDPDDWTLSAAPEAEAAWHRLRAMPEAAHLGLVAPRLLLRLPYGAASDPVERFAFEEFDGRAPHDALAWGHGAWAAAAMLASGEAELGGLPLYVARGPLGAEAVPCSEVAMSERGIARLGARGIMPLVWVRDGDAVRLPSRRSLAAGQSELLGGARR